MTESLIIMSDKALIKWVTKHLLNEWQSHLLKWVTKSLNIMSDETLIKMSDRVTD